MTDAKCPWCGAEEAADITWKSGYQVFECSTSGVPGDWNLSDHCIARTELAQHKQRLMNQSARLAAAESELRRLRKVIEAAETVFYKTVSRGNCGEWQDCKLVPLSELEEKQ